MMHGQKNIKLPLLPFTNSVVVPTLYNHVNVFRVRN